MSDNQRTGQGTGTGTARRTYTESERRGLLVELKNSGLGVSEFARRRGMHPTVLYRWRRSQRRRSTKKKQGRPAGHSSRSGFVQVDWSPASSLSAMIVRAGSQIEIRIHQEHQVEWAARLVERIGKLGC